MPRRIHLFLLALLLFICSDVFSQEHSSTFIFIPGKLLSPPLTASYQEPRVGLRKEIGTSRLKVDIGATLDMLEVRPSTDSLTRLRIGIDFFTYALSTNSEGLRLQIDAVDGYFGGHITFMHEMPDQRSWVIRLRLLHLSAHFLDGHFNAATQSWKDNRSPIPFTRDFGELLGMYNFGSTDVRVSLYGGFSYATLIRPTQIQRLEWHGGFEVRTHGILGSVFGKPFDTYVANHVVVRGIPSSVATNNAEFGVKFGEWSSTGLKIYLSYYNGLDVFSQYYDIRRKDFGIGFAFDFW